MTTKSGTRSSSKPRARTKATRARSAKTATSKSTAVPRTRAKAPAAQKVEPKLVEVKEPVVTKPDLRKQELIDLVVERSGVKKRDAKPVVEAALAVLGEALADGRELNLRPMGKLKISRREDKANGKVIICRVRQPLEPVRPDGGSTSPAKRVQAAE